MSDRTGVDWTEKAGLKKSLGEGSILISKLRAYKTHDALKTSTIQV